MRHQGRSKKLIAADGRLLWLLRLSIVWGRTVAELEHVVTGEDLALYQALVEVDGPWWGEREAAYLRQLCSVQAAAGAGADLPPDRFLIDWQVGPGDQPAANLLPPADGLALFAARHGLDVVEEPAP